MKTREEYNAYMRTYLGARYAKRREWALELLGGKCVICGSVENLQFDHKKPSTRSFRIARKWFTDLDSLREELKKCQLLCFPCHNIKTLRETGQKPARGTHGTISSYRYCKCPLCKKAHSDYCKEYNRKRLDKARTTQGR